jgi:hypothetical protein
MSDHSSPNAVPPRTSDDPESRDAAAREFAERDARAKAGADRMPTADEEAVADGGATDVDMDAVARHEEDMLHKGANVRGEGEVP